MKTDYAGIDYSSGKSNVDDNGIHYGIIQHHIIGQFWYDDSQPYYNYFCPHCEMDFGDVYPDDICKQCGYEFKEDDFDELEPVCFDYNGEGIAASQSFDDPDIFVFKSPYFTYAQFCSPCAPGAGYLMNWTDKDIGAKTYCFGNDWFESEKAPYPVYSVKTGKLV